jgi:hypothetical protein
MHIAIQFSVTSGKSRSCRKNEHGPGKNRMSYFSQKKFEKFLA